MVVTIALTRGRSIRQFDFNNTFLSGDLSEDVFTLQVEGSQHQNFQLVCKLNKALYGLKQASQAWFTKLSQTLQQFGFQAIKSDPSLFARFTSKSTVYILVYVDGILITGNDSAEISDLITQLHTIFTLKDLGNLHYFLVLEANYISPHTIHLSQTKHIKELLNKTGMASAKAMLTRMLTGQKLSNAGDATFSDPTIYRSIVEGLQYATITRPLFFSQ